LDCQPGGIDLSNSDRREPNTANTDTSIAISLKRIADALEKFLDPPHHNEVSADLDKALKDELENWKPGVIKGS
jgi:hypothetical protein